jgi:hypothetical protein
MAHYVIQPRLDELRIGRGEPSENVSLLSVLRKCYANVLSIVLFYDNLSTKPCMTSKQSSPHYNKTLLNRNIFQFTPRNVLYWDFTKWMRGCDWLKIPKFSQRNRIILCWENLVIFSQSQLRIYMYLVKSQNNTFLCVKQWIINQ